MSKMFHTFRKYLIISPARTHKPWISIGSVIFVITLFIVGSFGKNLFQQPDAERFLNLFFGDSLLLFSSLLIAWYITALKSMPSRLEEYKFLNSMPISTGEICSRLIYQDLLRFSWIPGINLTIYFSLLPASSIPHLCRLSLLTVFTYSLFTILNTAIHFLASLRKNNAGKYFYPCKNDTLILFAIISGYGFSTLSLIVIPQLISGYPFLIVLALILAGSYFLLRFNQILFTRWQEKNLAFQFWEDKSAGFKPSRFQILYSFHSYSKLPPLLIKNVIRFIRGKYNVSIILTVAFITIANLCSMNNEFMSDRISVLLVISYIYSFLIAYYSINMLSLEEESPNLIYSLPLRRSHVYFATFIPNFCWLAMVMILLTISVVVSGSGIGPAGLFWLKSLFGASVFLLIAINYSLAYYPDIKKAKKHYLYGILILLILSATLYKYRIIVLSLIIILSLVKLRMVKFYRIT